MIILIKNNVDSESNNSNASNNDNKTFSNDNREKKNNWTYVVFTEALLLLVAYNYE